MMIKNNTVLRLTMFALLMGAVATVPALAGSAVIGSVAGSMNATIGGQSLLLNTTIFSGDSLQVRDGVAVIAVGNDNRVIFGRDTVASFLRDSNDVTVLLSQGNVSVLHSSDGIARRAVMSHGQPIPIRRVEGYHLVVFGALKCFFQRAPIRDQPNRVRQGPALLAGSFPCAYEHLQAIESGRRAALATLRAPPTIPLK